MPLIVIVGLAAILFLLAFISKRRFGVLGLALCAGALISTSWADVVTPWLEGQGVVVSVPPLSSIVSVMLVLLPALLLLFGGLKYHRLIPRLVGSVLFAILAIVLVRPALQESLQLDTATQQLLDLLQQYGQVFIAAAVIIALLDVLFARNKSHTDRHKK